MEKLAEQESPQKNNSQISSCPVCGSAKVLFHVRWREHYVRCGACGLIFHNSPVSQEERRKFYEKKYYGKLETVIGSVQQARSTVYDNLLDEAMLYRQTGRLLDVGCGHGDFLQLASEAGWEAWGIEPSQEACEAARRFSNIHTICGTVEETEFPAANFDVLTLWNVLDCFLDPMRVLKKLH